ncbi:MDR/zinc-dependent alcohol dehydrogenase-like family protein [Thermosipho atlanticus]|uniref:Uncharacterized protein n=1 Tax=Thermosipho atlanticus DSM 15807 TaxID=1123380 RepID=A0A1M5STA5_9BACT|nr:hypothetical protein [Thermosipho atlanticus]SHH41213.1 hypothetical protein SAMN02745199_1042 [Thermosipho atlanticus DSM 15807]
MNKKLLLILIFVIIIFVIIFVILVFLNKSNSVITSTKTNVRVTSIKDITYMFEPVGNVSFFEPYFLNINFNDVKSGDYQIVNELRYLGFYSYDNRKEVYIVENGKIIKYNIKDLISQRYYVLSISKAHLVVLDTFEGTIKLIISNTIGGFES